MTTPSEVPHSGSQVDRAVFAAPTGRLRSIDVFRGLVLAFMLFTPPFGTHWPILRHAVWDGWTLSDLVFPAFLVASGASLSFLLKPEVSRETRLRMVRRTITLLVLGVLYNAYGTVGADMARVRVTGVLQLIGVAGAIAAVVVLTTRTGDGRDRLGAIAAVATGLPLFYGLGLVALTGRCEGVTICSPYHGLDLAVLGESRVYRAGQAGYDPEGLLVMVVSAGIVLAGYLAGSLLRRLRPQISRAGGILMLAGAGLFVVAHVVDLIQPINKRLHTPAFQLLAIGVSLAILGLLAWLLDRTRDPQAPGMWRRWDAGVTHPFVVLGRNALVVYLSERFIIQTVAHTLVESADGEVLTLRAWLFERFTLVGDAGAELLFSSLLLLAVLAISYAMHALRWRVAL